MRRTWKAVQHRSGALSRGAPVRDANKMAYAAISLQTWVTRKQTVTPITTGMSVATVVHFALRVSL
jgi:hypothetical protein